MSPDPFFRLAVAICAVGNVASACRYNVRDIAFVDLRERPYVLSISGPPEEAEQLVNELGLRLRDANVAPQVAATGAEAGSIACRLEAPDGRVLPIDFRDGDDAEAIVERLGIDDSFATALSELLIQSHSVVLLVEGADAAQNEQLTSDIEEAIREVESGRALWPKGIRGRIEKRTISRADQQSHRQLLWGLGIEADLDEPQVAVVFGRCRRLGDVLSAERVAEGELPKLLSVVSMDCECEYDIAPLVGSMAPHHWGGSLQKQASEALGFDPGLPLVLVEVEQILARRDLPGVESLSPLDGSFGYREIALPSVPMDDEETETTVAVGEKIPATMDEGNAVENVAAPSSADGDSLDSTWKIAIAAVVAMGIGGSLLVIWTRR